LNTSKFSNSAFAKLPSWIASISFRVYLSEHRDPTPNFPPTYAWFHITSAQLQLHSNLSEKTTYPSGVDEPTFCLNLIHSFSQHGRVLRRMKHDEWLTKTGGERWSGSVQPSSSSVNLQGDNSRIIKLGKVLLSNTIFGSGSLRRVSHQEPILSLGASKQGDGRQDTICVASKIDDV
jgi:hypothetical protein